MASFPAMIFSLARDFPKTGAHPHSSRGQAFRDHAPHNNEPAPAGAGTGEFA
jgi:hypothetical protein